MKFMKSYALESLSPLYKKNMRMAELLAVFQIKTCSYTKNIVDEISRFNLNFGTHQSRVRLLDRKERVSQCRRDIQIPAPLAESYF